MTVETNLDRTILIADFGETFKSGNTLTFKGIFDREYNEVLTGGEVGFSIPQAQLMCKTDDISTLDQGSSVTRVSNSQEYVVTDVQNDGTGMTLLILERTS